MFHVWEKIKVPDGRETRKCSFCMITYGLIDDVFIDSIFQFLFLHSRLRSDESSEKIALIDYSPILRSMTYCKHTEEFHYLMRLSDRLRVCKLATGIIDRWIISAPFSNPIKSCFYSRHPSNSYRIKLGRNIIFKMLLCNYIHLVRQP